MKHKLYLETWCFIKYNYIHIMKLIILITLIQISVDSILLSKQSEFILMNNHSNMSVKEIFSQISTNQRYTLIQTLILNNILKIFINTILYIDILLLLKAVTKKIKYCYNFLNFVKSSVLLFPKLSLLIFCNTLFIQIGLVLLLIPGIIIAILTSLSPIILINKNNFSVIKSIYTSVIISCFNIHLITPIILMWFVIKIIISIIWIQYVNTWDLLIKILLIGLGHFISLTVLVFLHFLYFKIKNNTQLII